VTLERKDVAVKRGNVTVLPPREVSAAAPFTLLALAWLGMRTSLGWPAEEVCRAGALRAAADAVLCVTAPGDHILAGAPDHISPPTRWHAACSGAVAVSYLAGTFDNKKLITGEPAVYNGLLNLLTAQGCARFTKGVYDARTIAALGNVSYCCNDWSLVAPFLDLLLSDSRWAGGRQYSASHTPRHPSHSVPLLATTSTS
jgi:hypothetical protein